MSIKNLEENKITIELLELLSNSCNQIEERCNEDKFATVEAVKLMNSLVQRTVNLLKEEL